MHDLEHSDHLMMAGRLGHFDANAIPPFSENELISGVLLGVRGLAATATKQTVRDLFDPDSVAFVDYQPGSATVRHIFHARTRGWC